MGARPPALVDAGIGLFLTLALLLAASLPAAADILRVGPGQRFARPSDAAAVARPGDRIQIGPGEYRDCAIWHAADLSIEAAGGAVVITGPACGGKALFVTAGARITITGLTFRGASVSEGNGAGIRGEGAGLTVRRSRFEDNENGILATVPAGATLLVEESIFLGNGALRPGKECAHGLYAGGAGSLVIRRSRFEATRICHHVKSRAAHTEVSESEILDTPEGLSSYLIDLPNGGEVVLRGNHLRKGPRSGNAGTAIAIGFEGVSLPTPRLLVEANRFENLLPNSTVFVGNRSAVPAELRGNRLSGAIVPLGGPGRVTP